MANFGVMGPQHLFTIADYASFGAHPMPRISSIFVRT